MNENPMKSLEGSKTEYIHTQSIDLSICKYCNSTGLKTLDKFCFNCRFPVGANDRETKRYFYGIKLKKDRIEKKRKTIKKARIILFVLAAINFLYGIIMGMLMNTDGIVLIGSLIVACIYFGIGMWSRAKPYPAILSGFFIFIVFSAIAVADDPHTIYRGIVLKVIIIYAFVVGFKAVKEAEILEKELNNLKISTNLSENNGM